MIFRRLQGGERRPAHGAGIADCHRHVIQLQPIRVSQIRGMHLVSQSAPDNGEPTQAPHGVLNPAPKF